MVEESQKERQVLPKESIWARLKKPPKCSFFALLIAGMALGIIMWGGLNTAMEWTNRSEFCISCHEMSIPYEELKQTVHYKNRSGTTVNCSDCHVASSKTPTDYMFKSFQKLMAARDVIGKITGVVDTPEKFEAHRLTMAKRVWERMESRDSKECRNCHNFATMDPAKQKSRSQIKHEEAQEDKITCITCHKGIAHKPVHTQLEQKEEEAPAAI
jgi:cytochrome c-type protein NapC